MIYPKKIKKAAGGITLPLAQPKPGLNVQNTAGLTAAGISLADGFIPGKDYGAGVTGPSPISTITNGAKFTQLGAIAGPYGAAAGAVADLSLGTYNYIAGSREAANQAKSIKTNNSLNDNLQNKNFYNSLYASKGPAAGYSKGGVMNNNKSSCGKSVESCDCGCKVPKKGVYPKMYSHGGAVILGGKRHADGGNDVVDDRGEKVAETEVEELLLNIDQTKSIEELISKYDQTKDSNYLTMIGDTMKEIINNQTKDNSGKYAIS